MCLCILIFVPNIVQDFIYKHFHYLIFCSIYAFFLNFYIGNLVTTYQFRFELFFSLFNYIYKKDCTI